MTEETIIMAIDEDDQTIKASLTQSFVATPSTDGTIDLPVAVVKFFE